MTVATALAGGPAGSVAICASLRGSARLLRDRGGGMVARVRLRGLVGVMIVGAACASPSTPAPALVSNAGPAAPATVAADPGPEPEIPPGSADYAAVLADARAYKRGTIDFAELQQRIVARGLPPHPLGDVYVISPVPAPPPGVPFDPRIMPGDWKGTWGEVAMTYWAGQITRDEYDRLHRAAHPVCSQ